MQAKLSNYFWLPLLVLALTLVPTRQYSCMDLANREWIRTQTWTNCYEKYDGHTAGYSYGGLRQCWFGQCGDWAVNYNAIAYYNSGTSRYYGGCWYAYYQEGCCSNCGHCWGWNIHCYGGAHGYTYCDNLKSHSCGRYGLTVSIHYPCHKYCGSCFGREDYNACYTCHNTFGTVYRWQNYSDITHYTCRPQCYNRTDNLHTGQYIRNVGDYSCSFCDNSLCSQCTNYNGAMCRTCVTSAYLRVDKALCQGRFSGDITNCATQDYVCYTSCPPNLYFKLNESQTSSSIYDWASNNADSYVRSTNVCYLCHRYCLTCTNNTDTSCSACASGFFQWQQQRNRCGYYCPTGSYTAGSTVGEFVQATYSWGPPAGSTDYSTYRQCQTCDAGCYYCASTSSTCYICQDNYFLLDDNDVCSATFNCPSCPATNGCASRNKLCSTTCPSNYYFKVYRDVNSNSSVYSTYYSLYLYFTKNATAYMSTGDNYYAWSGDRIVNSSATSRWGSQQIPYRYYTNFCKLCDFRCITCTGPTNLQCTSCVNNYYKWTNLNTCENYCPKGQFKQDINAAYPTNETTCANCNVRCQVCQGYNYNCSICVAYPSTNYAFLYNKDAQNSTCQTTCPSSSTPLTSKGYYGSIKTMQCHPCPGGCSNCNINYFISNYNDLSSITCGSDNYCSKFIVCTSCLTGYSLAGGACISQSSCRLYSYYVQGQSSSAWSPSNCYCLDGYYNTSSTSISCANCHVTCLTCSGSAANNCLTCPDGLTISNGYCVASQILRYDYWILNDTDTGQGYKTVNDTGRVGNNDGTYKYCGSYYTLFGYKSQVSTATQFYYSSPTFSTNNFYAINIRMKVLFIDNWEGTAGLYFRLGSASAEPFAIYSYNNFGAVGEMQCGANNMDYLLTVTAKASVSPSGSSNQYSVYVNANKNAYNTTQGLYYYWGIQSAVFSVLKCDSSCGSCTGPTASQCKSCSDGNKIVVNGICVCNVNIGQFYPSLTSAVTASCMTGCPKCNYTAGSVSDTCYYTDSLKRACVNPPTKNCSAPNLYGQPYDISNSYGSCVQNCSSNYYAIQSLMKCTKNCTQFSAYPYHYNGASAFGGTMKKCVDKCPSGLIADPVSWTCVSRCPSLSFLMLQNRDTNPKCTTNCSTGYEYDNLTQCVLFCPSGYFTQTLAGHNKCVQVCVYKFGDNVTGSCLSTCPTPSWADPNTQLCVETCPNGTYAQVAQSNGNRTCVSICESGQWLHPYYSNCSKNPLDCPLGTYADNNTKKCQYKCTKTGQVGENTTRLCQTGCNTGFAYWNIGMCVSICPTSPSMFSYVSGNTRICVDSCNSSTTGLYGDEQASRSCVANCSATPQSTFGDNSTNKCVKTCPVSNQYGDPNHLYRQCTTWCSYIPTQTYYYTLTKLCVSVCPDGYYGDNTTTTSFGLCSTTCNSPYYGDSVANLCVIKCPYGYYGSQINGRPCTKVCPSGWYGINGTLNRVCVQTCDSGYWADGFTRMCYNTKTLCSNNTYADAQAKLCVNGTLCTAGTYADPTTMGCESTCSSTSMFGDPSTNLCVSMCPASPDYYSLDRICASNCATKYADWQANRTCVTTCSKSPIPLYGTASYRCVNATQCAALGFFGNNNTQLCSLCSGTLPFGDPVTYQCVYNCSKTYYGDPGTKLCVLACNFSLILYADNATQQCTTFCTLGTFGVNSSTTPLCQQNCPALSYALDSNRICVANCGTGFFGDPLTGKCYNSSLSCSDGYYGNTVTNMCVLPADCQTNPLHFYADNVTKRCIVTCTSPYYGLNTSYTCVLQCPTNLFAENTTRMCSVQTGCGLFQSYADSQLNICVSVCSTSPAFTYAENVTYTCVVPASCPANMFAQNTTQKCVYYCPKTTTVYAFADNYKTKRCVATCLDYYFGDISSGYGLCASVCPGSNYFRDNRTQNCVYTCPAANSTLGLPDTYGDSTTDSCVVTCASGWFAQNQINRTCVQICQAGTWGNTVTRMCITNPVSSCPAGTWADNFTNLCVSTCNSNSSNVFYGENNTRLCVPSCPVPSFAYTVTRVCIDICPYTVANSPGYFGDPGSSPTRLCVTNCLTSGLYRDTANNRTCQPTCTYNSTYKSYQDPTIRTCVAECPTYPQYLYAQGNSSANAKCGASCSTGYKLDSNMSCVSTCPALLDPTTGKCVDVCPFSSALNTVLYANLITNICVTAANCPTNTYASDDLLQCVSTCPTGTYISGKNCMVICPDGTYINPSNQSCVVATSCPSNYYGNNQTGTCVLACTNGTFSDQTTRMCLTQCYDPNYGDPLLGKCSSSCSNNLIKNNLTLTCVGSCSTGYFYSSSNASCVSTCPSNTYADSKTLLCVTKCSSNPMTFASTSPINACVTVCPASAQWFDLINRVCIATCPTSTYQYSVNMSCVAFCPPPYYLLGSACSLSCSSTSSYADDITRTCLAACPSGYFKDSTTYKCVVNCPVIPTQYYAENTTKSCVTSCPSGYADIQKGMCVAVCSISPVFYAEPNTRTCVQICPASYNQFADPTTQSCVTFCPNGYYADNRERKCLQSCASIYFADNLANPPACVSSCTLTTYADPLLFKCVTNCSAGYFSYTPTSTCVQFCPFGYFADGSSGSCEQQCRNSNYQYADNFTRTCTNNCSNLQFSYKPASLYYGTCLLFCPSGYFSDPTTMKCVTKCPDGYFGYTVNNTCKTTCPQNQFMDSINNLCQVTCPAANSLFGQPFSRKCVTNCTSTGYAFLFADSNTRRCNHTCSSNQFGDPNTLVCVGASTCTSGLFTDPYYKLCVSKCYNNTFAYNGHCYAVCPVNGYYADQNSQSCVLPAACATGLFADPTKGACVQYCDIASNRYADTSSRTCLTACSSPLFADNITRTCASVCTSIPQYYGLNSSRICVMNCPNNTFGDPTNNFCVLKCASGYYGDKNTWTCVTQCPLAYFGDNSTNLCVITCPSGMSYFGDPFALICVLRCSNGLFADPLNNRECSSVCASPNFAQNSTMNCISNCLTGFANPNTRQCIANCSQGYYGYNFICYPNQCPPATPSVFADDTTNLCVTTCPNGFFGQPNSRKCVQICPVALNLFANKVSKRCVANCPSDTYADPSVRQCVTQCASMPALFSTTQGGNLCLTNCTNGLFANNSTRSCVVGCPNSTYAENSTYTCVSMCPTKPMKWADNLTNTCVYQCSVTYDRYADNSTRTCVINCAVGTFAEPVSRSCKPTCASGYFAVNTTRRCQTVCPSSTFADTLNRMCVSVCPVDPIYYGDIKSWICLTSCPNGSYGNPLTQQCVYDLNSVSACPVGYYSDSTTKLCVEVCPMKYDLYAQPNSKACKSSCVGSYLADNSTMRCVATCPAYPSYFGNLASKRCVKYCPNGTYADNLTRTCVTSCPNGTYAENSTWRCVSFCTNTPLTLRDSANWKCVPICPTGYFADYFNRLCVASCPASGNGFARNDTKQCVKSCPNNSFSYLPTRTCVVSCYNNTYAEFKSLRCLQSCPRSPALFASSLSMSCVASCPPNMFAHEDSRTCVYQCPSGLFRHNLTGLCVQFCPHGSNYYADNVTGNCVTKCSVGSFADPVTSRCLAVCPNQPLTYAENITRTCLANCPPGTFGQNKTRICVDVCPSGSLSYTQSNLCVFVCPDKFFAYKITQFCVQKCPSPLYGDPSTRSCVAQCPKNQLLYADDFSRTCVSNCPKGSYAYQWAVACLPSCPIVSAPFVQTYAADYDNTCTEQCDYPYFSYDVTHQCLPQCPDKYYNDVKFHVCQLCPITCATCTSGTNCKSCLPGYYLQQGQCKASCTLIYYASNVTGRCVTSPGCAPNFGVNSTHTCQSNCPSGQWSNTLVYRCDACPSTCVSCTSLTNCLNCRTYSVNYNNFCYGYCNITTNLSAQGMWFNADNKTCTTLCPNGTYSSVVFCKLCSSQCSTCFGLASICTNCTNGKYLINNTCTSSCPKGYLPNSNRVCAFCNTSCGSGLTYTTNVTNINGQNVVNMNYNSQVNINGNLYNTFSVKIPTRLLQTSGSSPAYQIVVIDSKTVQFIFPPGVSPSEYRIDITNPQNVRGPNGQLPNSLTSTSTINAKNVYSTSVDNAPSAIPTYFIFLSVISLFSFLFDLELMRFLQLLYVHYFLVISYPPELFKIFSAMRYSTMYYLPRLFGVDKAVLLPEVPDTVYNAVGDYNFLRNAGFAFTPLLAVLILWGLLKLLSVPEINRFKNARVWCRNLLQKKFKYAVILQWVSIFITNTAFFAFLQLRNYVIYDTFTQVSLILAHVFIIAFVIVIILLTYRVVTFHREHPQLSQNLKKASELILNDNEVDQLVSTNVFLSQKKKIDLRDIFYPQINNQNLFPFRCLYKYNILALLCPSVLYLRSMVLSFFIAIASKSVQLQMALCIPLNVLTILYFSKTRPYTFKFRKYRIRNYIVLYHQAALIIFQFLLLIFGIKDSAGATSTDKEAYSYYIIYYLVSVCTVSLIYHLFMIVVYIYRKIWLVFISSEFFAKNFPQLYAKYQSAKLKPNKLVKTIDPKAKQSLKKLIKGYKNSKSALRPTEDDKANPNLPVKYKLTYFNRSEASSTSSKTTLSKTQKKQMLKEIFGDKKDFQKDQKKQIEEFQELREKEQELPDYQEYEEEIEIKAKDLAKYVSDADHLLKMKKTDVEQS